MWRVVVHVSGKCDGWCHRFIVMNQAGVELGGPLHYNGSSRELHLWGLN